HRESGPRQWLSNRSDGGECDDTCLSSLRSLRGMRAAPMTSRDIQTSTSPVLDPEYPPTVKPMSVSSRWYQFSGADLVFLLVALCVFQTSRQGLLDDPGLGWHLRNIDAMLAKGGWLTVDPFSEPRDGRAQ